jgi:Na+/melibiose symporter-like transporter
MQAYNPVAMAGSASPKQSPVPPPIGSVVEYFRVSRSSPFAVFVWIKFLALVAIGLLGVVMVFDTSDPRSLAISTVFAVVGLLGASFVWVLHWVLICHERELRALREVVRRLDAKDRDADA